MLHIFKSNLAREYKSVKLVQKNEFEGNKVCPVGIGFHETSPYFRILILHHLNNQFIVLF